MKKYIVFLFVLAVLTVCGHAGDTNQTITVSTNKPASDSNGALALLAAATNAAPATAGTVIPTNKPAWESTVALGLTLTSGNSESVLASGSFRTHRNNPTNEWTLGLEGSYGENNAVENNETLHGFGQYNRLFGERWYGYARADALHDGIADVTYRFTFSPGAGYYFVKNKQTSLAGEFGPAVLYEKLDDEYHTYPTLRLAERFEHRTDEHTRFWQNVEFLPQADQPDNFLVNAEVGAEAALTKRLSLRTVVQDNFANDPAPGRKDNDVKLISGLAYKF